MNQLLADPIARKHQRDFSALIGRRMGGPLRLALVVVALFIGAFALFSLVQAPQPGLQNFEAAQRTLASSGLLTDEEFFSRHNAYREWLYLHGTSDEQNLFDSISITLFENAAHIGSRKAAIEGLSFFQRIYFSLHFSLLRICFVLIASYRLWLFAILLAAILEFFSLRVHQGVDFLGQTGNGRLFFSGFRISLDPAGPDGAPQQHVRGLACAAQASTAVVRKSRLGKTLETFGVDNATNLGLAGVILHHREFPAYIAAQEETPLLEAAFAGANLGESSTLLLERALKLHQKYRAMQMGNERFDDLEADSTDSLQDGVARKMQLSEYISQLIKALHRVLTPEMRTHLSEMRPAELATLVLALEAGKVLAYSREGAIWTRKSNFPHLSARSILHSMAGYGQDYSSDERTTIRRALMFAERSSVFAPVRFPIDLSEKARAARQWAEVLLACPHELQAVADEVELVGIVGEAQRAWSRLFLDGAMALDPAVVEDVYATPSNLLFVPVTKVLALMRKVVEHGTLRRLEELIARVSQKQRLAAMSLDFAGEGPFGGGSSSSSSTGSNSDRVFTPLAHREIKALAGAHSISAADIRDWSSFRVILNNYGWLARRIGDHTVPESSLVSVVFKADKALPGANEFGRIGKHGMVALRGTRLETRWGSFWQSRFVATNGATMAEDQADYEQLLKGIEKKSDDDEQISAQVANDGGGI
ncbi:MAG: hypothetical protein K1X79_09495 [Oligoflexia bacterium]|nr:hypothetical protein [Oligoflexia bacterium]